MRTATDPSRASARLRLVVAGLAIACWCVVATFAALLAPEPGWAQEASPSPSPAPTADSRLKVTEILQRLYGTVTDVVEYQQDIEIHRNNPYLAQPFLPPYLERGAMQPLLTGRAFFHRPDRWEIMVRWLVRNQELKFVSTDGYGIDYISQKPQFTDLPITPAPQSTTPSPEAASPAAEASASPSAAPPPAPSPALAPSEASGPTAADLELYRHHPLTLIWPFVFKPLATSSDPYTLLGDEVTNGRACWVIQRHSGDMIMKIWVDQETYAIDQIQYTDPQDGQLITGLYKTFYELPGGLRSYQTLEVTRTGRRSLYDVTTPSEPTIVTTKDLMASGSPNIQPSPGASSRASQGPVQINPYQGRERSPFTIPLIVAVTILLIGLTYFGGRYLLFLLSRAEFSRDLILLEGDDGPVGRFLKEQGYIVTRCSLEVLTEERKRLGKKVVTIPPRAVIVAPDCFPLIKNYLFLLKAYVEEGGRVLVLRQSASSAKDLPFQAYFVPYAADGRISLQVRHSMLKRISTKDAETRTGRLLPKEMYVEINQRKLDVEFVQALNKTTGVRAVLLGVVREAKGEFILCQFDLVPDLAETRMTLGKAIFMDVLDYTQGVKPEKKAPAPAARAETA